MLAAPLRVAAAAPVHIEVSKNDELCIKNEDLRIENEELCVKNEDFCIKNDDFCSAILVIQRSGPTTRWSTGWRRWWRARWTRWRWWAG